MSEYDCTHCGRAPVLEDEIEDLEKEIEQLKAANASLIKAFASQTARLATKIAENARLKCIKIAPWPPCMAPDGAEPCGQYTELMEESQELRAENARLKDEVKAYEDAGWAWAIR